MKKESVAAGLLTIAYLGLALYRFRSVPDGLVNDAAEEALRGLRLLDERRVEVMTFTLGNSAETLWLYVVGLSAKLLGPTVLAVVLPSALAAAGTVFLTMLLVLRLAPATPVWIPFLLSAGSPWLLHYARSGFRAIAAPLFLAASALALARASERPERAAPFAAAGALVGLSLYAYTACRLLPIALVLALLATFFGSRERRSWLRAALSCAAGFGIVSIPNALFFARHPAEFLTRGGYVLLGTGSDRFQNALATALLPFDYPSRYRTLVGPSHFFDGASSGMTSAALDPIPLVAGLFFAAGLVLRLRRTRDLATTYLAFALLLGVLLLGPAGPSLTRLLVLVPAYLVFASFGAGAAAATKSGRLVVLFVLIMSGVLAIGSYFSRVGDPARSSRAHAAAAATAMGERARAAADRGPVLCVVTANANVVRYLARGTATSVIEFYDRPFDPREVAGDASTLLVERVPELGAFVLEGYETTGDDPRFRELRRR